MGRFAGACTLILGIFLATLPAGAAQRVALVVGNSDYKLISPLANPANDAALMAQTLRDHRRRIRILAPADTPT